MRILGLAALGCALASVGCGSGFQPPSAEPSDNLGDLGLELQLANGSSLDQVRYVINGPAAFSRSGSLSSRGSMISTTIGDLPAGMGYGISVTATTADGGATCTGSATFGVTAHATTIVVLQILCRETGEGGVVVGGRIDYCPVIDSLTADLAQVDLGRSILLKGAAHDSDGPAPITYRWEASVGTVTNTGAPTSTFTCTQTGPATVTLMASDGICFDTLSIKVSCALPKLPLVRINEIESSGGMPGDWVELYNAGTTAVDISGWLFRDQEDDHKYAIPPATMIAPGSYYVLEEAALGFGLGVDDKARLFDDTGIAVVDAFAWTAHATTTYGRCPNGSGNFATTLSPTKGSANDCGTIDAGPAPEDASMPDASVDAGGPSDSSADDAAIRLEPWPGADMVTTVDGMNVFGANLSGLTYQPAGAGPAVLWAVRNGPSTLFRLVFDGTIWTPFSMGGWANGKALRFVDGMGNPDSEAVSKAEWDSPAIYVATERNNDVSGTSRLSILRYDGDAVGTSLTATHEWNLTPDLPVVGSNLGLEGLTWVPDAFLVAGHFVDESTGQPYDPSVYADHGTGVFIVGLEANGVLYAYVLDHVNGGFHRVATFGSGHIAVMDVQFDREAGNLWSICDNTCGNKTSILQLDGDALSPTRGKFRVVRMFDRPSTLPNANNEGITFAPDSECSGGMKPFFWTDDDQTAGHAIRRDSIPCGALVNTPRR